MRIFSKKVLKIFVLNTVIGDINLVVETLNVIMHIGSGRRCPVAIGIPHVHNLSGGHLVVLVFGVCLVLLTADNLLDNLIGVEFGEMVVVPGCDRHKCFVTMDSIDVGWLIELDESVARMGVFVSKIIKRHLFDLYIVLYVSL
jgi:hypothetical protein